MVGHGPHIAPREPAAERDSFGEVALRVGTPALVQTHCAFHRLLRDGVPVEYPRPDRGIAGDHVRLVDLDEALANDWLTVNQFTVIENSHNRRPDIVVFVNGLPLA